MGSIDWRKVRRKYHGVSASYEDIELKLVKEKAEHEGEKSKEAIE